MKFAFKNLEVISDMKQLGADPGFWKRGGGVILENGMETAKQSESKNFLDRYFGKNPKNVPPVGKNVLKLRVYA